MLLNNLNLWPLQVTENRQNVDGPRDIDLKVSWTFYPKTSICELTHLLLFHSWVLRISYRTWPFQITFFILFKHNETRKGNHFRGKAWFFYTVTDGKAKYKNVQRLKCLRVKGLSCSIRTIHDYPYILSTNIRTRKIYHTSSSV